MSQSTGQSSRLTELRGNPKAQVLIIGGGINGLATFRDLALQGVDVVLVEQNDYCSGASAASSHMIHGGVRYLENGEIRLVKESLQERNRLFESGPSLRKATQDHNADLFNLLGPHQRSNSTLYPRAGQTKRTRRYLDQGRTAAL